MTTPEQRQALSRHAEFLYRQGNRTIADESDRADFRKRWEAAAQALGSEGDAAHPRLAREHA